jgi:hypothetical protein
MKMKNVWIKKFLLFVLVLVLLRVVCGRTGSGIYSDRDDKSVSINSLSASVHKEHIWIPVQLHTSDTANKKIFENKSNILKIKICKWIFTFPENIIGIMFLSCYAKIIVKSLHQVFTKRIVKNALSPTGKNTFHFFIWLIALVLISALYVFDILTLFAAD